MIKVVNKYAHKPTKFDYYIGRPSILGNPWSHKSGTLAEFKVKDRDESIAKYNEYFEQIMLIPHCGSLLDTPEEVAFRKEMYNLLDIYKRNKELYLVCWCKPAACHGDIIKKWLEFQYIIFISEGR